MIRSFFTKFIDATAPFYDSFFKVFLKDEAALRKGIVDFAKLRGDENVLDVGCGTGTLCMEILKKIPDGKVHGIDLSPAIIKQAKKKSKDIDYKVSSATKIPHKNMDVIFSTFMFHLLEKNERAGALKAIKKALRKGGKYISVEWDGLGMNEELLKNSGFKIIKKMEKPVSHMTIIPSKKMKIVYRVANLI